VDRYRGKISGPLLDRIDLHVEVPAVAVKELGNRQEIEPSNAIRDRVMRARKIQTHRFRGSTTRSNGQMSLKQIYKHCALDTTGRYLIEQAIERLGLSARAYARILKTARTIADLAGEEKLTSVHVAEAIGYRTLDRNHV
jgi:magnesium chelatase family protein